MSHISASNIYIEFFMKTLIMFVSPFSCKQSGNSSSSSGNLWPPFRLPSHVSSPYTDPQRVIACRSFHAALFMLLYKALNEVSTTDQLLALTVYLLELTVEYQAKHTRQGG